MILIFHRICAQTFRECIGGSTVVGAENDERVLIESRVPQFFHNSPDPTVQFHDGVTVTEDVKNPNLKITPSENNCMQKQDSI